MAKEPSEANSSWSEKCYILSQKMNLSEDIGFGVSTMAQESLINHIVITYFLGAHTMCWVRNRTDQAFNVPMGELPSAVMQVQNGMVEAINLGCSVFLIEEDAVLRFLDESVKLHDAARFRCSTKYFLIMLQSTGDDQVDILEDIQMHSALEDMPNFLLMIPKDGEFEFVTNRFGGNFPESSEYLLLDKYSTESGSFVFGNNLFPDKLDDLMGKTIKLASFYVIPWSMMRQAADGTVNYRNQSYTIDGSDGYSVTQFGKRYNCTWELYVDEKNLYGQIYENGTGNGMFGALLNREVDFAIGAVGAYISMFKYFSLSKTLQWAGVTCITPKPRMVPYWKFIFMIFSPSIWSFLIMTFIVVTSCLYVAERRASVYQDKGYMSVLLKVLKTFVLASADLHRTSVSSALLITSLLMFTLIVGNVYIGQIHSIFTLPPYQSSVDTIQDLIKSELHLIAPHAVWMYSMDGSDNPNDQKLLAQFQVVSPERMAEIADNGREAIMIAKLENGHSMVFDEINARNIKHYRIMREMVFFDYEVAYATKTWPLLDRFDYMNSWVRDACLLKYVEQMTVNRYMDYWVQVAIEHSRENPHVQLKNMVVEEISGALMVLGVGHMFAILVFILECGTRSPCMKRFITFNRNFFG